MTTLTNPIFTAPLHDAPSDACVLCAHCNLPVPVALVDSSAERQFCCPGCRAVYDTLHACGLDAYYHLRDAAEASTRPIHPDESSFQSFDSPTFHNLYVQKRDETTASVDLVLEGVTCAACVWLLERLPRVLGGVIEARLSLRDSVVRITWDTSRLPLSAIARTLSRFGYTPHPARSCSARQLHQRESRRRLIHLAVAGAIMGNTMLLGFALYAGDAGHMSSQYRALFRSLSALLGILSLAWPGATFFRSAYAAIRARAINLDVPITLAIAVGGLAGLINVILGRGEIYFDSLSVLVFLLLVGRFIQYRQQRSADDAVSLLFSLTPSSCRLVKEDITTDIPVEALRPGDIVEVRPGELFPADGVVRTGSAAANEALLTGESMPVPLSPGSPVHAASQNTASVLRVQVTQTGSDTRVGKLMHLVERGVQERPPILLFADRVGRWFTLGVSVLSVAVFSWWLPRGLTPALDHTIAFLIVTCPCVLGLATPMTLALAIGQLARRDTLVKSGASLEALSRTGRLLLDKTGTLTQGRLTLLDWTGDTSIQPALAALERHSNHPVGIALSTSLIPQSAISLGPITESGDGGLSAQLGNQILRAGSPGYMARHGITIPPHLASAVTDYQHRGTTAILVSLGDTAIAAASLGDRLRPDTASAITHLRQLGWTPSILSGDAQGVVNLVSSQIGIIPADARGQLSPEDKLSHVRNRPAGVSVMVGDGVNDAAALAAADVGIAVHGGAEASLAAADIYIARPGLAPLVDLIQTSRRTLRTIRISFLISLAYNLLAGSLAAAGVMSPLVAAILMPISSATVLSMAALSARRLPKGDPSWT